MHAFSHKMGPQPSYKWSCNHFQWPYTCVTLNVISPPNKWSYEQNTLQVASKPVIFGGLPHLSWNPQTNLPKPTKTLPTGETRPTQNTKTRSNQPRPGKRPSGDFSVPAFDWQMLHWPRSVESGWWLMGVEDPAVWGELGWMGSPGKHPRKWRSMMIQRM